MFIQAFPSGPFSTNAYVIGCPETRQAAIIDPAPKSSQVIRPYLTTHNLTPDKILLTHSHWDHIAEAGPLQSAYQIPIYIHRLDSPNLEQPGADGLPFWIPIPAVQPDFFLEEGQTIHIGNLTFQVIHTPGHSPGSICFYNADHGVLIAGDTLFKDTIGNLSFPTCQPELMWPSLDKLARLPPETKVYPGHGPTTTIGAESWLPRAKERFG